MRITMMDTLGPSSRGIIGNGGVPQCCASWDAAMLGSQGR